MKKQDEISNIDKILTIANEDYESFVKAIVMIEKGIEDNNVLDKVYSKYMRQDNTMLLSNDMENIIDKVSELENNKKLKSDKSKSNTKKKENDRER